MIGEENAVGDFWAAARDRLPRAARGPAGPAGLRARGAARSRARPACAPRRRTTSSCSCRRAPRRTARSSGIDPLARDPESFRWRTRMQIEDGRSWLWVEGGTILFKAEASAWTPSAVQLQQVWVDPTRPRPRQRAARDARPLPAAARARAGGLPVRPRRERAGDPGLREGRHAAHDLVSQPRLRLSEKPRTGEETGLRLPKMCACGDLASLRLACSSWSRLPSRS